MRKLKIELSLVRHKLHVFVLVISQKPLKLLKNHVSVYINEPIVKLTTRSGIRSAIK